MNTPVMHTRTVESIRPLSNDDRRAAWASRYFAMGLHRRPEKPRIKVTVPTPIVEVTKDH